MRRRIRETDTFASTPECRFGSLKAQIQRNQFRKGKSVKGESLHSVTVRRRPGCRHAGVLRSGPFTLQVSLGRSGIAADKREGDGASPRGRFRLRRLWWRPDRMPRPRTLLPAQRIGRNDAWSEDPADRLYNRPVRREPQDGGDRLWRDDHLYDLVIELDHNTCPRIAGRGSAVFVHVMRPDKGATAGCVALPAVALRRLLARLSPRTVIDIR